MSYSRTLYDPTHPERFPEPQLWMAWTEDLEHEYREVEYDYYNTYTSETTKQTRREIAKVIQTGRGKIRHKNDLADARKHCGYHYARKDGYWGVGPDVHPGDFTVDWKIYEFVDGEWVLRYEGFRGQAKKDHPLYSRAMGKKLREESGPAERERYALEVVQASMKAVS